MQKLRKNPDRSKNFDGKDLARRLYEQFFDPLALSDKAEARRHADTFEAAYELARKRPALAADLLLETEQVDRRAGLRAGLRDGRTCRRHTYQSTADGGRAER